MKKFFKKNSAITKMKELQRSLNHHEGGSFFRELFNYHAGDIRNVCYDLGDKLEDIHMGVNHEIGEPHVIFVIKKDALDLTKKEDADFFESLPRQAGGWAKGPMALKYIIKK